MNDDNHKSSGVPTIPPPADSDLYSANTKVGEASADLLAIVRAAEDGTLRPNTDTAPKRASHNPTPEDDDAKLTALKAAASRAAQAAAASEIAKQEKQEKSKSAPAPAPAAAAAAKVEPAPAPAPAPAKEVEAPKAAAPVKAAPPPKAAPAPAVASSDANDTQKRPALKMADEPRPPPAGTLPPAAAILLVFALAAIALVAIVR